MDFPPFFFPHLSPERQHSIMDDSGDDMTAKLFVGGLAGITTSEDIRQIFAPLGKLKLGQSLCVICLSLSLLSVSVSVSLCLSSSLCIKTAAFGLYI